MRSDSSDLRQAKHWNMQSLCKWQTPDNNFLKVDHSLMITNSLNNYSPLINSSRPEVVFMKTLPWVTWRNLCSWKEVLIPCRCCFMLLYSRASLLPLCNCGKARSTWSQHCNSGDCAFDFPVALGQRLTPDSDSIVPAVYGENNAGVINWDEDVAQGHGPTSCHFNWRFSSLLFLLAVSDKLQPWVRHMTLKI